MALKVEIDQWQEAVACYERNDYEGALTIFKGLSESAKINFNIGLVHDALEDYEAAFDAYEAALNLDNYMSIAHFQKGNCKYYLEKYEDAVEDFERAFIYLRGNLMLNYSQLGMDHTLYSCEIAYNKALCHTALEETAKFKEEIMYAMVNKQIDEHDSVIPRAVKVDGKDCKLFRLPKAAIFKPAENKTKNTKKVDYLGKSKVVGSADDKDTFTGFAGKQAKEKEKDIPVSPTNSQGSAEKKNLEKETKDKKKGSRKDKDEDRKSRDKRKSSKKEKTITPPAEEVNRPASLNMELIDNDMSAQYPPSTICASTPNTNAGHPDKLSPRPRVPLPPGKVIIPSSFTQIL
ncbi:hypothetical protein DSO57_1000631 [Entomophthora muscae]|uniref:Uncharacterized protein n=1 Tax=Entomophthora muscae TaxID=34485 RepID=A0ACC2S092_9FUNG|nr:hypothetical protein DSO57_1000631 [Entomophthora muscae]